MGLIVNKTNWKVGSKVKIRQTSPFYMQTSGQIGKIVEFDPIDCEKQAWVKVQFKKYSNTYRIGPNTFDLEFAENNNIFELWSH